MQLYVVLGLLKSLGCSLTLSSPKPIVETGLNWTPGSEQPERRRCLKYEPEPYFTLSFTVATASLQDAQNLVQALFNVKYLSCAWVRDTQAQLYTQRGVLLICT